jgi:hypothetical protein
VRAPAYTWVSLRDGREVKVFSAQEPAPPASRLALVNLLGAAREVLSLQLSARNRADMIGRIDRVLMAERAGRGR